MQASFRSGRSWTPAAAAVISILLPICVAAGDAAGQQNNPKADESGGVQQFIREVTTNELAAEQQDHSLWEYKQTKTQGGQTTVREVVQTNQGAIYRTLSVNGQPLKGDDARKEEDRVKQLAADPERLKNERAKTKRDSELEQRLLRMVPDAFHFSEIGRDGKLVKLDFTPNPAFHPTTREANVFHHMAGTIWVDPQEKRIARIEGHLVSEVKFGGGFLGHLAKGGTFSIEQQEVGPGYWELTRLNVNVSGRALFFKTISVHQAQTNSNFRPVHANTSVEQAEQMLNQGASATCCG